MKDSTKFLITTLLGISCYIGYVILVFFRGPRFADFIIISVNMFIWLFISLIPDYIKLRRAEKEQLVKEIVDKMTKED